MTSARIDVADLWTGEYHDRHPLSALDAQENSHIHARLSIEVGGRTLPRLGFFGPDDVCLNTWVPQLLQIRSRLRVEGGRHVFDEGEQGQPAYVFERSGSAVLVSVLPSQIGGGPGDESWSGVACRADDFLAAVDGVLDQVRARAMVIGERGERWWRAVEKEPDLG